LQFFRQISVDVYDGVIFVLARPLIFSDHLAQFDSFGGFFKRKKDFLRLIWFCSAWVLWKKRNARIFKNYQKIVHQLLDKINGESFCWMKAKHRNLGFNYHSWWTNPLILL